MPLYDCGSPDCMECQRAFGPDRTEAIKLFTARAAWRTPMDDEPMHTEAALREAVEIGFCRGAQMMREMMARFVEQGGDAATAQSIRANWNPAWGDDPGKPDEEAYQRDRNGFDPFECA